MSSNLRPNNLLLSGFLVPPDTLQCRVLSDMPRGHAGGYHLGAHPDSLLPGTLRNIKTSHTCFVFGALFAPVSFRFALGHPVSLIRCSLYAWASSGAHGSSTQDCLRELSGGCLWGQVPQKKNKSAHSSYRGPFDPFLASTAQQASCPST